MFSLLSVLALTSHHCINATRRLAAILRDWKASIRSLQSLLAASLWRVAHVNEDHFDSVPGSECACSYCRTNREHADLSRSHCLLGASRSSRSRSISLHQCACGLVGACSWRFCIRTSDCKCLRLDTSVLSCSGSSRRGLRSAVALFANSIDVKTLSDQGEPCSGSNPCNHLSGHRIVYVTDVSTSSTN